MSGDRIKGNVIHKGNIVPIEVEIAVGEVIIHIPNGYVHTNLIHMVYFKSDLDQEVKEDK